AVPASIFADAETLRAPLTVPPITMQEPAAEIPTAPSPDALIASEIETMFALHRSRACLGEGLEVTRGPFGVKVQGVVETATRRDQLVESLRLIPLTIVEIQTIEEALKAKSATDPDASGTEDAQAMVNYTGHLSSPTFPLQESMRRYFAERGASSSPG